ncbi:DUF1801 domain-containing protein [Hymenobacter gummosus]|uniref:DUF1801 domain-containing protein n=1 Tax=Hymenobacter gummosus TaxID=1776032 RepID=A0A3S0H4S6_9BACT|nr:DUF1801 domain-containing protein [Hymenobacter gummosus]RTQ44713.1 DUF1801 domain-containing protein [Hymenobacter gummosus]
MPTSTLDEYLHQLEPALRATVEALRRIILSTHAAIGEQVKWNSPSFYYRGALPASADPKQYPCDIVVLNLHRGYPLLVFPTGARIPDAAGVLEGSYPDGRRLLPIRDAAEAEAKAETLQHLLRQWLATVFDQA